MPAAVVEEATVGEHFERGVFRAKKVTEEGHRSFRSWAELIPEPKAGALRFDLFPYQVELYESLFAEARDAVIMKSTQVGASSLLWRWAIRRADEFGDTALYIFPTDTHVTEFGDERIEPSIEMSEYLQQRISRETVRHKRLKKIGRGFTHLRGSNSKAGAQSVDADCVVFDEYDYLDATNVPQIERRLSGALAAGRTPRVRRIGTPTVPGFGIAKVFDRSDKRRWHVTCPDCGEQQTVTFADNMRWTNPGRDGVMRMGEDDYADPEEVERAWRACKLCEAELDVAKGEWIRTAPERSLPGWHMTRMIVPRTDLAEIVRNSRKTEPHEVEAFWNNDLGEPYSSTESSLDPKTIAAACSLGIDSPPTYTGPNFVTMGVDVAGTRPLQVRVSEQLEDGRRTALFIGEVKGFEDLPALMDRYRVGLAGVDANPERRSAQGFAARFPGRVVLVEYTMEPKAPPVDVTKLQTEGIVRAHRTMAIDAMMDSIRKLRNMPSRIVPEGYVDHLTALHRRVELDAKGRPRAVYISTGPDDYGHAEAYDLIAKETWLIQLSVGEQMDAMQPRHVAHEEMGFRPTGLESGDDYDPGLGGVG